MDLATPKTEPNVVVRITREATDPMHTKFGLLASKPDGPTPAPMHALGEGLADSSWISASELPDGAGRISGDIKVRINVDIFENLGGEIITSEELRREVADYVADRPRLQARGTMWDNAQSWEAETLLKNEVPASAIDTPKLQGMRLGSRAFGVLGGGVTLYELDLARRESVEKDTPVPLAEEGLRQAGSWAGAAAGAKVMGTAGAALGAPEAGVGALVLGFLGAGVGGVLGYMGVDFALSADRPTPVRHTRHIRYPPIDK